MFCWINHLGLWWKMEDTSRIVFLSESKTYEIYLYAWIRRSKWIFLLWSNTLIYTHLKRSWTRTLFSIWYSQLAEKYFIRRIINIRILFWKTKNPKKQDLNIESNEILARVHVSNFEWLLAIYSSRMVIF